MRHALEQHGNPLAETARGQIAVVIDDFLRLPQIVDSGSYHPAEQKPFGPRRVEIRTSIDSVHYTYVGEIRTRRRRIDMVTMWKR